MSLEKNISKLYILRILQGSWISIPTIILFYKSNSLGLSELLALKALMSFVVIVLEIPSGYIADKLGRKNTLISAGLLWMISNLLYYFNSTIIFFTLAEIFLGMAMSLVSGADSAILYDTLKNLNKDSEYKKLESKMFSFQAFSESFSGFIAAFLASYSLKLPFLIHAIINIGFVFISLILAEPKREISNLKTFASLTKATKVALFDNLQLRYITLFTATSAAGTLLIVFKGQAFFEYINLPIWGFGVAWCILHIILGLSALSMNKITEKFGTYKSLYLLTFVLSGSFLFLALLKSIYALVFIALIYWVRGVRTPLIRTLMNEKIDSELRATTLSISSFCFRIAFVLLAIIVGYTEHFYTLQAALILTAILLFLPSFYALRNLNFE